MMRSYLFLLVVMLVSCTQKQEIAQWRGLNRDGIFNEKGLLKSWPEKGPDLLWSFEALGDGYGSVAVTNDKIFVNGVIDSISYLMALNTKGDLLWKTSNGPGYVGKDFSSSFPGSRSTPTVIGNLVYAYSGLGRIACFDVASGTEKWAVDMLADMNGIIDYFGYGESPLILDNKLFCYPGGKEINIAALDRFTGEKIWTSEALADTVSHCSPIIIDLQSRKVFVTFSIHDLMGLDAESGELLWSHKQTKQKYTEQSNTPIFQNGYLYYLAGDGNGAVKLELANDGSEFKELWRNDIGRNAFNGFVVLNDKLYSTINKNELFALNTTTGEIIDSLKIRNGSIISADEMIYCYSDNGEMQLVDISKSPMEITGNFKIEKGTKHHFAHPVIKNGVLYIRHGNTLMAYDLTGK